MSIFKKIDFKKLIAGLAPVLITVVPVVKQIVKDSKKTPTTKVPTNG